MQEVDDQVLTDKNPRYIKNADSQQNPISFKEAVNLAQGLIDVLPGLCDSCFEIVIYHIQNDFNKENEKVEDAHPQPNGMARYQKTTAQSQTGVFPSW